MQAALYARRRPPSMSLVPTALDLPVVVSPGPSSAALKYETNELRRSRQRRRRIGIVALAALVTGVLLLLGLRQSRRPVAARLRTPSKDALRIYIYDLPPWLDRDVRLTPYAEAWLRQSKEYDSDIVCCV